jgi:hypothetical protein
MRSQRVFLGHLITPISTFFAQFGCKLRGLSAVFKKIAAFAILSCALATTVQASTVPLVEMSHSQWAVLEFENTNTLNLVVAPTSANGSFSFTYAFSEDGCGDNKWWFCMPKTLTTNKVNAAGGQGFGEGWFDVKNLGNVQNPININYTRAGAANLLMFFRVTSGSGAVSQVASAAKPLAPVPLPAAGFMLFAAMASFGSLRLLKRQQNKP